MTTTKPPKAEPDDQERGSQAVHRVLRIPALLDGGRHLAQPDRDRAAHRADAADRAPHDQALQRESLFVQGLGVRRYALGPTSWTWLGRCCSEPTRTSWR